MNATNTTANTANSANTICSSGGNSNSLKRNTFLKNKNHTHKNTGNRKNESNDCTNNNNNAPPLPQYEHDVSNIVSNIVDNIIECVSNTDGE
jgi:hypothetical protein